MPNLTIKQAALFCGKDEKTVRRWITGKHPRVAKVTDTKGRYLIAQTDLERIMAEDAIVAPVFDETRLVALEARLRVLEQLVGKHDWQIMTIWDSVKPKKREIPLNEQGLPIIVRENTTRIHEALPDGYAALTSWCELHGIAETTARRYLPPDAVKKGTWTGHDGSLVKVAIDRVGQHHLWELFHNKTRFKPCAHCPHDKLV